MTLKLFTSAVLVTALASGAAFGGADCPTAPKDSWMSESDMQKMILDSGYTIDRFKIDDNCYEIYGKNAEGQKVEVYFNPVNGEVVKLELED